MKNYKIWLKYIAVFPVAILSLMLMTGFLKLFETIPERGEFWTGFFGGVAYIVTGTLIAPDHKKIIGFILVSIIFIFLLVNNIISITNGFYENLPETIGNILGAIIAFLVLYRNNFEYNSW